MCLNFIFKDLLTVNTNLSLPEKQKERVDIELYKYSVQKECRKQELPSHVQCDMIRAVPIHTNVQIVQMYKCTIVQMYKLYKCTNCTNIQIVHAAVKALREKKREKQIINF